MNFFTDLKSKVKSVINKLTAFFFVKKSEFSDSMESKKFEMKNKYEETKYDVMDKFDSAKEVASEKAEEVSARFSNAKKAFMEKPEKEVCEFCAIGNCKEHGYNKYGKY